MRFKNFTLLFLMGFFGLFTTNLFAQEDATIDPADVRYWIGEGENQVVVAISWCSYTETALAWGYRFDGDATVFQALTDIAAADSRLTIVGAAPTNITYVDGEVNLTMCPNPDATYYDEDYDVPMHSVNGLMGQHMMAEEPISNNDFVKVGGYACGVMSSDWTTISWSTEIMPAIDPNASEVAVDASISAEEIKYWIGEGEHEVILAVNWAEPNVCLAWGYRFPEEEITVKDMMIDIQSADARFSFEEGAWGIGDIKFQEGELDLHLVGAYWWYLINGSDANFGYDQQILTGGEFVKWGDIACATEIAEWTYVWEQNVEPVSIYDAVNEYEASRLSIYPNPAVSETFVTIENAGLNEVSVYDIQGRLVSKQSIEVAAGEKVRLSTEMLNAGVFYVTVSNDSVTRTAKLVVK